MKIGHVIFIGLAVVSFFLIFYVVPYFTQPVGVPLDFYDLSDNLTESEMDIFYRGNLIPLNDRVEYSRVDSILNIPTLSPTEKKAIIIQFDNSIELSNDEVTRLVELYQNNCYYVILIDYTGSDFNDLIDSEDVGEGFIILDYTVCGEIYYSTSLNVPEENTQENIQYLITHQLEKKIDD